MIDPYLKLAEAILNSGEPKYDPVKQSRFYKSWYARNGRKRDPIKQRAHNQVAQAVKNGTLVRPEECSVCFAVNGHGAKGWAKIEAHHPDYSKPLEVIWLCAKCHNKVHPKGVSQTV